MTAIMAGEYEQSVKSKAKELRARLYGTTERRPLSTRPAEPVYQPVDSALPAIVQPKDVENQKQLIGRIVERLVRLRLRAEEQEPERDYLIVSEKYRIPPRSTSDDRIKVKDIIRAVEYRHGIKPGSITGASRNVGIVAARQEAMWIAKELNPHLSLPHLGRMFNRDHTTVIYSLRRYEERLNDGVGSD